MTERAVRRVPRREVTRAVWAAVLTPATRLLPGLCARTAGAAGWIAPLAALPGLLLMAGLLRRTVRGEEDGLAPAILRLLGRPLGGACCLIYIVWALLLAAARLRLSGQYFLTAVRQPSRLWLFLPVMACAAAWLARGRPDAFARTAALFARVLMPALAGVIVLSLFQIRPEHLWPVWTQDLLPAARAGTAALGVLCCGVYGAFLPAEPSGRPAGGAAAGCGLLAAAQACILGNLGARLTGLVEDPFLTLCRNVGVEGAIQRLESLTSALWLLSDLALAGLMLCACRRMIGLLLPGHGGGMASAACAGVVLALACTLFRDAAAAGAFGMTAAPAGNLALGLLVPGALYLLERRKGRPENGGISCGPPRGEKANLVT